MPNNFKKRLTQTLKTLKGFKINNKILSRFLTNFKTKCPLVSLLCKKVMKPKIKHFKKSIKNNLK
jgi:hypothetical protein